MRVEYQRPDLEDANWKNNRRQKLNLRVTGCTLDGHREFDLGSKSCIRDRHQRFDLKAVCWI